MILLDSWNRIQLKLTYLSNQNCQKCKGDWFLRYTQLKWTSEAIHQTFILKLEFQQICRYLKQSPEDPHLDLILICSLVDYVPILAQRHLISYATWQKTTLDRIIDTIVLAVSANFIPPRIFWITGKDHMDPHIMNVIYAATRLHKTRATLYTG